MSRVDRHTKRMKIAAKNPGPWREMLVTPEIRAEAVHLKHLSKRYYNNRFQVDMFTCASPIGGVVHAVILRHGLLEEPTSAEVLSIKNDLWGTEFEAVEIFPADTTDMGNRLRHLWVMPGGYELPFGYGMPTAWGGE